MYALVYIYIYTHIQIVISKGMIARAMSPCRVQRAGLLGGGIIYIYIYIYTHNVYQYYIHIYI